MEPKKPQNPTQAGRNQERLRNQRELQQQRREQLIDNLAPEELLEELKSKGLPVFGTHKEKADRLKKASGIAPAAEQPKKGNVINNIEAISKRRDERRRKMEEEKLAKEERKMENEALGKLGDVDFHSMIEQCRANVPPPQEHFFADDLNICVCVRKRPIFVSEENSGDIDAVTATNPSVLVHERKFKVDGITKYLENHTYTFDNVFGEGESNESIYEAVLRPACPYILAGGTLTCFAYGQTGSGKTFTMRGLQQMVVQDLFKLAKGQLVFWTSFFEIYGGRCFDLLNNRSKLTVLEDGAGNIQITGLKECSATHADRVIQLIEYGNSVRTTHSTTTNPDSSRSHAVCQIVLRRHDQQVGVLKLVDLAGSERAQDCMSNNRQRRYEGAEINKSLLALKECIRALRRGPEAHVPYRCSKLTLVLRDSFDGDKKVIMITCISPGCSSTDHSLNSLRYSDRLKEQSCGIVVNQFQPKLELRKPLAKPPPPLEPQKPETEAPQPTPKPQQKPPKPQPAPRPEAPSKRQMEEKVSTEERFRQSFQDMQYIQQHAKDDNFSNEMLSFHEKVETILEEEEELLETHVNAIKEDAQILTEEGELIAMAQGEGTYDYDIDDYVARLEVLVKHKLTVYQHLNQKLLTFKLHLNEEEEVSYHLSLNISKKH